MNYLVQQKFQPFFEIEGISKQIQDNQYEVIQRLVALCFFPNMKTLEIGSWTGLSAILIGDVVERANGKHYCIDWFKGNKAGAEHLTKVSEKIDIRRIFEDNIKRFNLTNTIQLYADTSENTSKIFPNDIVLDFIFIDGNHNYEYVIQDFNLWYPRLKIGGIISGHDYNICKDAVEELKKRYGLTITIEEDIWWAYKNG